jgi:hypothetical protein
MKALLLSVFFLAAACATASADLAGTGGSGVEAKPEAHAVAPAPAKPCDAKCAEKRKAELDLLLNLGSMHPINVAESSVSR